MVEKIIAEKSGVSAVRPGELASIKVDFVAANDMSGPLAIKQFERMGGQRVFDPSRIALMPEHFSPAKDLESAISAAALRNFCREQGIEHYFDVGRMGIDHVLIPEEGLISPGDVYVNGDSHTCTVGALNLLALGVGSTDVAAAMALGRVWVRVPGTVKIVLSGRMGRWVCSKDVVLKLLGILGNQGALYKVLEIHGDGLAFLNMDERFTFCSMAVEAGAKTAIITPDGVLRDYCAGRMIREPVYYDSDGDAAYDDVVHIDLSTINPMVSEPHLPANAVEAGKTKSIRVDQVVIGSCSNGRFTDMLQAAELLRGKKVAPHTRTIVIPGSPKVFRKAVQEGLIDVFLAAGATVSTPNCGPCSGAMAGVLAPGEVCVTTTPRNFRGRMGHRDSYIYLAGPYVAAAAALAGIVVDPGEELKGYDH